MHPTTNQPTMPISDANRHKYSSPEQAYIAAKRMKSCFMTTRRRKTWGTQELKKLHGGRYEKQK